MADVFEFDMSAFEILADQLEAIAMDGYIAEGANQILGQWLGSAKARTPVGEVYRGRDEEDKLIKSTGNGLMRKSWWTEPVKRKGAYLEGRLYNDAVSENGEPYPLYMNYGHRQNVGQYVPVLGRRLVKPWVEGQFMLEKSMADVAPRLQPVMENAVKRWWEDVGSDL